MKRKNARSDVHPLFRFHDWQVWPGSYDNPQASDYPLPGGPKPRIGPGTPVAVIGSCFIREMKTRLMRQGFNVIETETGDKAARHGSAAWERLYNLASVRQVFEYALTGKTPSPRWWTAPQSGLVQDPYRRIVIYESLEAAEAGFALHRERALQALVRAHVLILSLDYAEIWEDVHTGAVICLPSGPYVAEGGDMSRYRCRMSTLEENLAALTDIRALLGCANPNCRLILVLSPIQQWCTFRENIDIFAASFESKAMLRTVAAMFTAAHPDVSYFPAYEIALMHRPALGLSVFAQGRENFHVDAGTLEAIMREFLRWYAGPEQE